MIDIAKLRDYCLSPEHPRGRHKARVFFSALQITKDDAELLRTQLLQAAREQKQFWVPVDQFGARYVVDFIWSSRDRSATIRSSWIVPTDGSGPRFITCFIL